MTVSFSGKPLRLLTWFKQTLVYCVIETVSNGSREANVGADMISAATEIAAKTRCSEKHWLPKTGSNIAYSKRSELEMTQAIPPC